MANCSSLLRFWVVPIDQNQLNSLWVLGSVCCEFNRSRILSQNLNELKIRTIINLEAISFVLVLCCHACLFTFRKYLTENSYAGTFLSLWMDIGNLLLNRSDTCSGLALKKKKKKKGSHSLGSQLNFKNHGYSTAVTEKLHCPFTCGNWAKERKKSKSSGLLIVKYLKIFWSSGFQWLKWPTQ